MQWAWAQYDSGLTAHEVHAWDLRTAQVAAAAVCLIHAVACALRRRLHTGATLRSAASIRFGEMLRINGLVHGLAARRCQVDEPAVGLPADADGHGLCHAVRRDRVDMIVCIPQGTVHHRCITRRST